MEWKLLNAEQTAEMYNAYMTTDFPKSELKPLTAIHRMMKQGCCQPFGVYTADGGLLAYAFLVLTGEGQPPLLDYYAVLPAARGQGWGSQVLRALPAHCPHGTPFVSIESEEPSFAPNPATARRRLAFYHRAGALDLGVGSCVYGVRYRNLALPVANAAPTAAQLRDGLQRAYRQMLPEAQYRRNISFSLSVPGADEEG